MAQVSVKTKTEPALLLVLAAHCGAETGWARRWSLPSQRDESSIAHLGVAETSRRLQSAGLHKYVPLALPAGVKVVQVRARKALPHRREQANFFFFE